MRHLLILCLLLYLTIPLHAQDEPTPYDIALQRIHEAAQSGATRLDLGGFALTEVPSQVWDLFQLQELFLPVNQLTYLPPEIGQLTNLQLLAVHANQLTSIPPEIGQLTHLQTLYLGANQLTSIPSEIGQLTNLRLLNLDKNQLTTIPPEIGQLVNLQGLYVFDNRLIAIPPEIGQLTYLQYLGLSQNQLTSIPSEIGQLINLQLLALNANQLHHLPIELGNLNLSCTGCYFNLDGYDFPCPNCRLQVDDNPLISPPPEVVEQGAAAVLEYLRNQAWYHLQRLIITGASGIGLLAMLMLGVWWKQSGGRKPKKKHEAES